LIGRGKFNYLINTLTLPSRVSSNSILISQAQHVECLIELKVNEGNMVRTDDFYSDTMLNYYLSQKSKLIGIDKFN